MKVVDVGKVLGMLNELFQLRELGKGKIREGKTMCMRGALLTLPSPIFSALSPVALPFALSFQLLQFLKLRWSSGHVDFSHAVPFVACFCLAKSYLFCRSQPTSYP